MFTHDHDSAAALNLSPNGVANDNLPAANRTRTVPSMITSGPETTPRAGIRQARCWLDYPLSSIIANSPALSTAWRFSGRWAYSHVNGRKWGFKKLPARNRPARRSFP